MKLFSCKYTPEGGMLPDVAFYLGECGSGVTILRIQVPIPFPFRYYRPEYDYYYGFWSLSLAIRRDDHEILDGGLPRMQFAHWISWRKPI